MVESQLRYYRITAELMSCHFHCFEAVAGGVYFVAAQPQQHVQAVGCVRVVVHDQDATRDRRYGVDARRLPRQGRWRCGKNRKANHELAALTDREF